MALPDPLDMTREIPALIAKAGGLMDLLELERRITEIFWPRIHAARGDDGLAYLKQSFRDAVTIAVRNGYVHNAGGTLLLRDRGRAFAWEVMAERKAGVTVAAVAPADIDLSNASTVVKYRAQRGVLGGRRVGGISWPSILCEVIFELGGFAQWPAIAAALEKRPEAEIDYTWREQCMQALRTHRMPSGKAYFEVADTGGAPAFALTERGRKVVKKRAQDDRAPSLSKYLVRAVHADGDDKLTDLELYTMLFLATRLGRAKDATVIYHRLPENFPDEDHYALIPLWINEAKHITQDDD